MFGGRDVHEQQEIPDQYNTYGSVVLTIYTWPLLSKPAQLHQATLTLQFL